jgi:2-(1,2-epoxy-1,2-dihydrophenyl)acetyl-CoA isomerase
MPMSEDLLTAIDGAVARITFNRPAARNAVNPGMITAMHRFLQAIEHDRRVRCIVLAGAGDHFMAGGDVLGFKEALERSSEQRRAEFEGRVQSAAPVFTQLARMPQPIVARVQGAAAGAAVGFVAGADIVICSENSIFIVAHVNIGASPDGSTSYYLPRSVGVRKATELAMLGEKLTASDALALGLVNRVVPDAELDTATAAVVDRIVAAPATSLRRAKFLMRQSLDNTLERQLQLEAESFGECAATEDFVEGVSAFAQKRKAVFNRGG